MGGTNYYVESILWKILLDEENDSDSEELIFHRYEVLTDPNLINKWKKYKGDEDPWYERTRGNKAAGNGCDHSNAKNVNDDFNAVENNIHNLTDKFKALDLKFENSLKNIRSTMDISLRFYRRTFYEMINVSGKLPQNAESEEVEEENECSKSVDIVYVEKTLMNDFLCQSLKNLISYLGSLTSGTEGTVADLSEVENKVFGNNSNTAHSNPYTVIREYVAANLEKRSLSSLLDLNVARFWNEETTNEILQNAERKDESVSYRDYLNEVKSFCESYPSILPICYAFVTRIQDLVEAIVEIRTRRLKMIRVVDDECLLDFNNEELLAELRLIDPDMLKTIHPNNRRKIIR